MIALQTYSKLFYIYSYVTVTLVCAIEISRMKTNLA